MTPDRANQLIVTSLGVTALVTVGSDLATGTMPGIGTFVGLGVTGVVLTVSTNFAPTLAAGFGVLVMVTSVFVYGAPLAQHLTSLTTHQTTPTKRKKARP